MLTLGKRTVKENAIRIKYSEWHFKVLRGQLLIPQEVS